MQIACELCDADDPTVLVDMLVSEGYFKKSTDEHTQGDKK